MAVHSNQPTFEDYSPEYAAFVEKFKPKKTTDDCYTPPEVFQCVLDYAVERYGIDPAKVVRPFYPGGDFERYDYPPDCVVLDNPPFSILSKIGKFYTCHGIRFFLFSPANVLRMAKVCTIAVNAPIIYENGAAIATNFITNLEPGVALRSDPVLHARLDEVCDRLKKQKTKKLAKLAFPDDVFTAARCAWLSAHGTEFSVRWDECASIQNIGATKIYGGGLLLSTRAAAERAAAERAAAERAAAAKLELTPKLKALQKDLDEASPTVNAERTSATDLKVAKEITDNAASAPQATGSSSTTSAAKE